MSELPCRACDGTGYASCIELEGTICAECRGSGRVPLRIGDVIPALRPKLSIRPAFTGAGKPSFKPSRNGK